MFFRGTFEGLFIRIAVQVYCTAADLTRVKDVITSLRTKGANKKALERVKSKVNEKTIMY